MSGLPRRFFSGSSLQQALMQAARHHGCEPERLAWRELDRRHGFLKGQRAVVIEVDPEAPLRLGENAGSGSPPSPIPVAPPVPAPAPPRAEVVAAPARAIETTREPEVVAAPARTVETTKEPEPPPPLDDQHLERAIPSPEQALAARQAAEMLFAFARLRLESTVAVEADGLLLELSGPDRERATAEHGRALYAIQHLLPRLLWGLTGEALPVRVDCANFHANQEEELRELAQGAAAKVRERGRPWHLEPMAPHERRIVHLALADDPEVETESVGEGYLKRVRVKLARPVPALDES